MDRPTFPPKFFISRFGGHIVVQMNVEMANSVLDLLDGFDENELRPHEGSLRRKLFELTEERTTPPTYPQKNLVTV
jgi:hypothetical protein